MDGDVPSIPFLCLMSPVGRTSDLSSGQGHKGTSEIPRAGSSNPESHLAGSSGIALGLLSSLSLSENLVSPKFVSTVWRSGGWSSH